METVGSYSWDATRHARPGCANGRRSRYKVFTWLASVEV